MVMVNIMTVTNTMMSQVTKRVAASEEFFRRRMLLQTDLGYHLFMIIISMVMIDRIMIMMMIMMNMVIL